MSYLSPQLPVDESFRHLRSFSELSLADVDAIRLLLRGDSIIDWRRLNFETHAEIDNFLRVNQFEPDSPIDQSRFRYLHQEAVQYLRNHFNFRFPPQLIDPPDIQTLFLHASYRERKFNRFQLLSCAILKVMSIIHHIEGRSLLFRTPIADYDLYGLVQERIDAFFEGAQRDSIPVVHIYGSRKSRDSMITKLLSKRDTIAATIFDKLRYRIIVERHEDLLGVLAYMVHTLLPFNFCIPGESSNNLVSIEELIARESGLRERFDGPTSNYHQWGAAKTSRETPQNIFSGSTYRVINFIVDLPVRLDKFLSQADILRFGRIAFVMVEFQVVDQQTEDENEEGENSHEMYKKRQRAKVLERLRKGTLVKKRKGHAPEGGDR